jgi:hypothetical protein
VKHAKIQENVEKTEKIKNRIENTIILKIREVKNESDFRKAGKQIASRGSPKTENRKKRCFTWNILRDVKREKWDGESDISRNEKMKDDLKKWQKEGVKRWKRRKKQKKIKMSWEKAKNDWKGENVV